ncbi:clan AA aspartic protease [Chamaesiphon sp. OTE_20_metabat_361]|uniref:clan AA aspartic protease n=1 Tax=Chamaesiphon sp. OTE_20_metabat_361 TaxID=2964689 RepID=UPI00286ACC3E|nr:clan AA aspartic protease [Chamaesiphon sp. OTE_20_metabat_361]
MMQGRVKDGRASLPITFRLSNQPDFQIEFVVDTGFNDYLTLPPQAISAMNLPQYSNTSVRLADGTETMLSIHSATIVWDETEIIVPVLAAGVKPLVGTALMDGYHLSIYFQVDGFVSLTALS